MHGTFLVGDEGLVSWLVAEDTVMLVGGGITVLLPTDAEGLLLSRRRMKSELAGLQQRRKQRADEGWAI